MKAIHLATLCGVAVTAAACTFILNNTSSVVAEYAPALTSKNLQEAAGMAEIMRMLKMNVETGKIEPQDRAKMLKALQAHAAPKSMALGWAEMGPNNQGGRTRALLVLSDTHIIIGAVSGGLWQSMDGANTWQQMEAFPSMMPSCIAQTGNGDLYVGTGSSFDGAGGEGGSGFLGEGLFRSSDMGATWLAVPGTEISLSGGDWSRINELAADVSNPSKVWIAYAGGIGSFDSASGELDETVGGGSPSSADDIKVSSDGSVIYASAGGGIGYRSLDGGVAWENISGSAAGKLPASAIGRTEFAISPQDPNLAYALIATSGSSLRGGYFTSNKGATWSTVWPGQQPGYDLFNQGNPQGVYDNCIIVDPTDKFRAIAGGVTLWDFGPEVEPQQIAFGFGFPGFDQYVHPDIHAFAWSPSNDLYIGTDGGIFKSIDGGDTFQEANRGYITTQFYNMAHDPYYGIIGGTQDNGTIYVNNNGLFTDDLEGIQISGGDGFACEITQINHGGTFAGFTTSQNGVVNRFDQGGSNSLISSDEDEGQFYTKIRLYENTNDPLSQQYVTLVNPYDETITDSTFTMYTQNLNLPFEYTLPDGVELIYVEDYERPEIFTSELLTVDPEYPWLEPQLLSETIILCDTVDGELIGTETIISQIIYLDTVATIVVDGTEFLIDIQIPMDTIYETLSIFEQVVACDTTYHYPADVVDEVRGQIEVVDPYTTILAWGLDGSLGLRITRQGLNFSATPEWWTIVPSIPNNSSVRDIEFTPDGTKLYFSTWNGKLFRVSNLEQVWNEEDIDLVVSEEILSTGNLAITGISIDPNDADHIVVSVGGYGGSNKVRETFNASTDADFTNIWSPGGALNGMPCYDVLIDMYDSDRIAVGTEFGIWLTENGGDNWVEANEGDMDRVPVFELRQQTWGPQQWTYPLNTGVVYAGTHGRGFFNSQGWVGVNEQKPGTASGIPLLPYPNPASDVINVNVTGVAGSLASLNIYDIRGKIVQSMSAISMSGAEQRVAVPVATLSEGTYVLAMEFGGEAKTGKFVIMR